jgi:hypothetical protein
MLIEDMNEFYVIELLVVMIEKGIIENKLFKLQ